MRRNEKHPESQMLSLGYQADKHLGAVKCPLFLTSTFAFKTAEEGKAFFELAYGLREKAKGEEMGMIYSRVDNPNLHLAEQRLAVWDGGEDAAFFSSGMAAISTMLLTFLKPGDLLIYGAPVYGGTDHFINHVLPDFGVDVFQFTAKDDFNGIKNRLEKDYPHRYPAFIFTEIPGNPTNALIDIEMCNRLATDLSRDGKRPLLAVDNTFLGPLFQHPLKWGADISVYSATKFIGGHSDLLAGACVGRGDLITKIKGMRTFLGSMLDPHSCWLILRSLETLKIRMERQAASAQKVAGHLKDHPLVEKVHYLGFLADDDPQKVIFDKQCLSAGSMIAFEVNGGEQAAFAFLNHLHHFKLAVSLGSTESLAEHPATMTHVDVMASDRQLFGITDGLVRLSIGVEEPEDLIEDIDQALAA
ncbi:cystathionine gamma-synthase family protein [Geofilum rubicundum]|uniref:Cystathionine gamma-synthase n=1 Tax=Geofilum rubicundum JCM 15548 TaxID=1236989 RepID=A0A0E9LVA8_9BACT|nr:cystathionine gamma-synthase family protein [Geofilum rubicundum]GAO29502.1 cystathionine gamma-synthase [Geofilum rubicundum JCM 15548]